MIKQYATSWTKINILPEGMLRRNIRKMSHNAPKLIPSIIDIKKIVAGGENAIYII